MEVNITLILQMMQFSCAYYFLYRCVFAPAFKILQEDEHFKNELYKKIEHEQQLKDSLLQQYHAKNIAFKAALMRAIPEESAELLYEKSMLGITSYRAEKVELSDQERKEIQSFLVDHLSQVIKK